MLKRVYLIIALYRGDPYVEDYPIVGVYADRNKAETILQELLESGQADDYWIEDFGVIE